MSFLNSMFQAIKFPKTNVSEWNWKWLIQIFVHLLCVSEKNDMKIVSNYWRFQQNMQPLQKCLKLSQVPRSSHSEGASQSCTIKPVLAEICKVHRKIPVPECLFKMILPHGCFPVNFAKFFKTFFVVHLQEAASEWSFRDHLKNT